MSQTASKTVHTTKSYSIWNIRSLTIMALMTALLIVSTYIKIPLPFSTADISWKTFIGQASGESYQFEWHGNCPVTVIIQPSERRGGISVSMD